MCKGRAFAFQEIMIFTAAIVAMWDIQGTDRGPVKIPRHKRSAGTASAADEVRVHIRRRHLAQEAS
jgi:hypothetical protein